MPEQEIYDGLGICLFGPPRPPSSSAAVVVNYLPSVPRHGEAVWVDEQHPVLRRVDRYAARILIVGIVTFSEG